MTNHIHDVVKENIGQKIHALFLPGPLHKDLYILFVFLYSEKYHYIIEKTIYYKENYNSGKKNNSLRRLKIFNCVGFF